MRRQADIFFLLLNLERPSGLLPTVLANISSTEILSHLENTYSPNPKKFKWKMNFLKPKVIFTSLSSDNGDGIINH